MGRFLGVIGVLAGFFLAGVLVGRGCQEKTPEGAFTLNPPPSAFDLDWKDLTNPIGMAKVITKVVPILVGGAESTPPAPLSNKKLWIAPRGHLGAQISFPGAVPAPIVSTTFLSCGTHPDLSDWRLAGIGISGTTGTGVQIGIQPFLWNTRPVTRVFHNLYLGPNLMWDIGKNQGAAGVILVLGL